VGVAAAVPGPIAPVGVVLSVPLVAWLALAWRRWLGVGVGVGVILIGGLVVAHVVYR